MVIWPDQDLYNGEVVIRPDQDPYSEIVIIPDQDPKWDSDPTWPGPL